MDNRPRGRAALREALLRNLRRPGEAETAAADTTPGPPAVTEPAPPPKPRGRAELFRKLQAHASTPGASSSAPAPTPPAPVSTITQQVERLQLTQPEVIKKGPKGISGTTLGITANYIRVNREEDKGFHRYEVRFSPDVDSKSARCKLVHAIGPELGGVHNFNGMMDLYLPLQMPNNRMSFKKPHPFDPDNVIELTIIYKRLEPYGSADSMNFINVLFKRIMNKLQMVQIKRNYFDFSLKKFIPQHALEVIPGYAVAVDELEGGLMICVDTCHKLLRKKSVLQLLMELRKTDPVNWKKKAVEELLGQTVITTYNNMNYIIDDVMWDSNPTHTFETKNGPVSYADYFKSQHGVEIENLSQPLLVNMRKKKTNVPGQEETFKICLIPELCNLTGISQNLMTNQFKKDMAEHTRLPPAKRFDVLQKYINNVKTNPEASKILSDWGLSIADGVIDLNARVITGNKIEFSRKSIDLARTADWGREIGKDQLIKPIDMTNWLVLCPDREKGLSERFVMRMRDLARGFGCVITAPMIITVGKGTDLGYREALEQNINDNVQIILCVVPLQRESLYKVIKNVTLARRGILGQVVLVRTLQNEKIISAVTLKLGLQMQAKLGGSLWAVNFPQICENFMFCGIDTFHNKGIKKSVGAITATIDTRHTRYYTGLAFQAHEVADALKMHFQAALEARKRMTGNFPNVVFMVRDGVGDGQLEHVRNYEMQQYLKVKEEIGADFKLCFLIIQKRNNQRICMRNGNNPPAGTVLDHTVTRRNYEDFYLVPQSTRIGTVSPAHYIVLHNDSPDLNLDRIQKLTFKLCHMYYNWTGAVSVPAPCQYAHKAAYLVGEHMECKPLDSLNEQLYYL